MAVSFEFDVIGPQIKAAFSLSTFRFFVGCLCINREQGINKEKRAFISSLSASLIE